MSACKAAIITAVLLVCLLPVSPLWAASCEQVVADFNARLASPIDKKELVEVLRSLNRSDNKELPPRFVTKRKARSLGWQPGRDLWSVRALKGASIGGDRFKDRERRLPASAWREADLDYKGGRRGAKRIVFSHDGRRFVTVDHYRTFVEIPSCQ